jgi:hypothetical protein
LDIVLACVLPSAASAQTAITTLSGVTCPGTGCLTAAIETTGQIAVQVTGSFSGTIVFEKTVDGETWAAFPLTSLTGEEVSLTTRAGVWSGATDGSAQYRIRFSIYWSGSASVSYNHVASPPWPGTTDIPVSYEIVTFAATAIGLSDATIDAVSDTGLAVAYCSGVLETAPIRMRVDGPAPTTTDGTPVNAAQYLYVGGRTALEMFRGIATTATSGIWRATCYAR